MKKNILLVFILLPVMFGCTVDYDLTIYDSKITEDFTIKGAANSDNIKNVIDELEYPTFSKKSEEFDTYSNEKVKGISYYQKKRYDSATEVGINYHFDFSTNNFYDSFAINKCYDMFSVINESDYIIISTNQKNKCIESGLDEIKIHLKTNHKVKENNADKVEGYHYYWNINKSNYANKNIYIMLYNDKYVFNYENEAIPYILGSVLVAFLIFIVIIFLRRRTNKNNRI